MTRKHEGSCQCGAVRFEVETAFEHGTSRCNCSICRKTRFWKVVVPAGDFRLIEGDAALGAYRFESQTIRHRFCTACGVKVYGDFELPDMGPLVAVNVMCLDDLGDEELATLPVEYQDGRHDRQDRPPEVTAHL